MRPLYVGSVAEPSVNPGWTVLLLTGPFRLQGSGPSLYVAAASVAAVSAVAVAVAALVPEISSRLPEAYLKLRSYTH